jgi:CheY-like chemotaxis protein/HPt (histidine-containing phosphotransfer) domain-containing protein
MLGFGANQDLPTILLIDDDLVSREVLATVLTMSGYSVHTAVDGGASLEMLAAGQCIPDVILMDAQMPGLSGASLISELRTRSRAVVVAMSGSNAPQELVATADGFLLKPFGADALQQFLKERSALADSSKAAASAVVQGALGSSLPARAAAEPVVEAATLARLREMMSETAVREIYAAVVADLNKRLASLEAAIAAGDASQVRSIGHAIKGGCGMAGALQAARLGALLEALPPQPKGNHLDNSSMLLRDLRAALGNLERMLNSEFQV